MLAVIKDLISVEMFASLGSDVKPLALCSLSFLINWKKDYKTVRILRIQASANSQTKGRERG